MADKTMPDERDRRPNPGSPPEAVGHPDDGPVARTSESAAAASRDGNERVDAPAPSSTRAAAPLITAVEIENFKGIGRPMRVEFKPITLLFGNNSAGKSTVLHALCYAHEILSNRDVDVHGTQLGGDRIDLGGFQNLVHAHDSTRPVRLRFELNLDNWRIPQALDEKIATFEGHADWSVFHESDRPSSGWIELQAKLEDERPVLARYELVVNDARVGCLVAREPAGVSLEFNPTHPMLERSLRPRRVAPWATPERAAASAQTDTRADRVREATGADSDGWKQSSMEVLGLFSPLPHWNEILLLDDHGQSDADGYDLTVFTATASALLARTIRGDRDSAPGRRHRNRTRSRTTGNEQWAAARTSQPRVAGWLSAEWT